MQDLDQAQLRSAVARLAARAGAAGDDFFTVETRSRLLERLPLMRLEPDTIVDLGGGAGAAGPPLAALYPQAQVLNLDWSLPALALGADATLRCCADAQQLPLADHSVDLVFANLLLPGCADPARVFSEARRVLRAPGLFLFNTLGPDTLKQIRKAWASVDRHPRVHEFADMHNIGDALVQAGFREPVMDVEQLTINYSNIGTLVADLRALAATNRHPLRARGLMSRPRWEAFLAALDAGRNPAGRFPISAELITGQAWTAPPGTGVSMSDGEARFPLEQLRRRS